MNSTARKERVYHYPIIARKKPAEKKEIVTGLESIVAENSCSDIYLPRVFARKVLLHLLKNYHNSFSSSAELILAIAGPFGVGKSVMITEVCRRLGINVFRLDVTGLTSQWEGEPAKYVAQKYYQASQTQIEKEIPCCLVLDDIDLSLGKFSESTSDTSNTYYVINKIMEIADNPTYVCGHETERIPIIVTANDLTKVYAAVRRPGRMDAWAYQPDSKDVFDTGRRIIGDILTDHQLNYLEKVSVNWTPAYFSQLKSIFQEKMLESQFVNINARDYIYDAVRQPKAFNEFFDWKVTYEELEDAIAQVENSRLAAQTSYVQC